MSAQKTWPQLGVQVKIRPAHQTVSRLFSNNREIRGRANNHRFPGFNDSCFLCGDGLEGWSQKLLMVQSNARDYGNVLFHGVRRVEPAAKTHLEDCELHPIAKIEKCHRRYHFKVRRWIEQLFSVRGGLFDGLEDVV